MQLLLLTATYMYVCAIYKVFVWGSLVFVGSVCRGGVCVRGKVCGGGAFVLGVIVWV